MKTHTLTPEVLEHPTSSVNTIDLCIDKKEIDIFTEDCTCIIDEVEFVKIIDLETKMPLPVVETPQPTTTATPRKDMSKFVSRIFNRMAVLPLTLPLCLVLVLGVGNVWGQTNPTAHDLSASNFTFNGFANGATTTYPTSMQGWKFSAEPTSAITTDANGDRVIAASTTSASTGSIRNEVASGISFLNSSSNHIGTIVVAVNTTNRENIEVTWTAAEVGTNGDRQNAVCLQYRIGTSGSWTNIASSTYTSNLLMTAGSKAAATFTNITIPSGANNQSIVQLRWLYYLVSGSGSRDRIRIDDITVSSTAAATVPAAPTISSITPGNQQLSVAFTAGSNGGSAITNYKYSTDGGTNWQTRSTGTTASPLVISTLSIDGTTPLTNGTSYDVQIRAVNAVGDGTATASTAATPRTTPSAPTITSITPGNQQLSVAFTAGSNGGSAITNYKYSTNGGANWQTRSPASTASPLVISTLSTDGTTALTNGVSYDVQIRAVNAAGDGTASSTTSGTPVAPVSPTLNAVTLSSSLTSTYGTASTGVSFTANGSNLTSNITATAQSGYEVSTSLGSGYDASVSVASGTTVYVRFASTISAGDKNNGTAVVLSGGGASSSANVTTSSSGNTVSQKALTITGLTAQNKVYDGLTTASATGTAALSGVVSPDAVTLSGTPSFTFASAAVGNSIAVSTSGYTLSGAQSANYSLTQPSFTANITVRSLTVTANDVNKYAGVALTGGAGSSAFTSSGLQNGETIGSVTIAYGSAGSATGDGNTVGVYASQVTPSAATSGTFTASNYSITYVAGSITVLEVPIIIASWDFTTSTASSSNENITAPVISQGNNNGTTTLITSTSASSGYTGASGGNNAGAAARAGSLSTASNGSAYFEFTITPNSGVEVTIKEVSFGSRGTSTAPQNFTLRSSSDSYSNDIFTGTLSSTSTWELKSNTTSINEVINSARTFRIYGYNGSGSPSANTANWRIDDLKIQGFVKSVPQLSTPTATSITTNSATLGATISSNGGATITSRGTVFKTSSPVLSSDNASAEGGTSTGVFTQSRSSLSPQTRYFYAGYAVNSIGTGLSAEGNFRTLSNPPSSQASGLSATSISSTQIDLSISSAATFPGSGATQGGYLVIYSSSGSPTLSSTNGQAPSAGVGSIFATNATNLPSTPSTSISVTGLSSSNTYNFLVIPYTWDGVNAATYNYLTTSAPTANATTAAGTPTLNSPTVSNITATSATLGATVTSNGGSSLTTRGTVFKTSSPVLSTDNALSEGGTTVSSYSHTRSSLSPQTLYYFAGYASNSEGTGLSGEGSFRTLSNPPSAQASSLNATASSSSQIDLTFTGATFPISGATQSGYVVIYGTGTPTFTASNGQLPVAGVGTIFTTSATILPSIPSTSVNVTGLNATTNYNFLIVPYTWDGTNSTTYHYLTTAAITASATTLNPTAGLQLSASNTAYVIDFDNTVSGVNNGQFSAPANWVSNSPTSGMLNSNAWAYSSTVGTGAATFGENLSAGGGQSNGTVTSVGPYSFQVSNGNRAWGIQPTSGDWTPGHLTLRIQNQTGGSLNSISLSFKIWVLNNEARSNSFNFSHSSDNSTYTSASALNLSSTATAEGTPTWKSYTRVVTISGLNIPNSGYYYLRWSGDDVSGSSSRDEFALDDITVIANPSTTFHSLSGTSQELVIDGNTSLGGNLTISGTTSLTSGTLTVGANTLNINGSINRTSGNIDASNASATVVFGGSTAQTIPASTFTGNINNLTLSNSAGLTTNQALTVNGNLTLSSGDLTIGATNLTLGSASSISSASASSHIVATSSGEVRKIYGGNSSFVFPVGDGTKYTPATLNFTAGGSLTGASDDYVGVRLKTSKVTGMNNLNTNYINRSWFIEPGAGLSGYTYTVNLSYDGGAGGDVVGTESEISPVKLSSGVWQYPGNASFSDGTRLTGTTGEIRVDEDVLSWSGLTSFSEFGGGGQGGPLPVELLSFNATCENDQIALTWQTASEHNSAYFEVEKSRDGETWGVIGKQAAAGNSNELLTYQFVDEEKNAGTIYYRLNQVDVDGKNEYYGPVAVNCEKNDFEATTLPNPSNGNFWIKIQSNETSSAIIKLIDIKGNSILMNEINIQEGINLYHITNLLESGMYFIQIQEENGQKITVLKHLQN
jgi:predicted RNA-binding protein with TRAM domain